MEVIRLRNVESYADSWHYAQTQHEKLPYLPHKQLLFTLVQFYIYSDNNSLAIVTSEWTQAKITKKNPKIIQHIPKTMRKQAQSLTSLPHPDQISRL